MANASPLRRTSTTRLPQLRWPLPALLAWAAGWAAMTGLARTGALPAALAVAAGLLLAAVPAIFAATFWRRVIVAAGFPLSLLVSGVATQLPAWAWLLPLALLAFLYPVRTWRDAPMFPTPRGALVGLARAVPLRARARVLDAGCGLGDGLRELHREYPQAQLVGLEWSWLLCIACGLRARCEPPFADVRRADIWKADWSAFDLVYLFQRPESMARAVAKASRELRPGAWLASLEFEASMLAPTQVLACADGRRLWLYRMP